MEIKIMFRVGASARTISITYIIVNNWASYNMIVGRPNLNRLRAVVSTLHLCIKYLVGKERPWLVENLKEVWINPSRTQRTRIDTTLDRESKEWLVHFLIENRDVFAWTTTDMPGIDPDFLCHYLSITLGTWLVAQKWRMHLHDEAKVMFITDTRTFCYKKNTRLESKLEVLMVHADREGIEANPDKCQDVIDM
ncbi:hypothetical protein CR513_23272, partial [Mucuna pruriens]